MSDRDIDDELKKRQSTVIELCFLLAVVIDEICWHAFRDCHFLNHSIKRVNGDNVMIK